MKYCPKCKTEYENWARICGDCQIELVYELPPEKKPEPGLDYVKIYSTPKPAEVAFIKSLLDSNGIEYFIKNEDIYMTLTPTYIDGFAWMEVMVTEDKVQEAKELLKDFMDGKT